MLAAVDRIRDVVPPPMSEQDMEMARAAQRCIVEALDRSRAATIMLTTDTGEQPSVQVPPAALMPIGQLLGALSEGRAVTVVPRSHELTTVQAANLLNVSRPFVVKEIEEGRLLHHKVGTHRRIRFENLQEYKRNMHANQTAALERMAENARELGLEYQAALGIPVTRDQTAKERGGLVAAAQRLLDAAELICS